MLGYDLIIRVFVVLGFDVFWSFGWLRWGLIFL